MRDIQDIIKNDKRQAAIHEAGHLTVSVALGHSGRAWLLPNLTNDVISEKSWTGKFVTVLGQWTPEICIAGVVAEAWMKDQDVEAWDIVEAIQFGIYEPSATDMRGIPEAVYDMGCPIISEALISTALELLREHKTCFDLAVAELINNDVITDSMADEYFYQVVEEQGN